MNHSQDILDVFDKIFNEKQCNDLCRRHKFIQRSSNRLKGSEFIKAMILDVAGSLNNLCRRIKDFNEEADLSAQALCKKINSVYSVLLMKDVFTSLLRSIHVKAIDSHLMLRTILGRFNSVKIEDSTSIMLNECLARDYQGVHKIKSQIKINLIYDVMKGIIEDASLHEGRVPDQALAGRIINYITAGDLIIRDLGYFVLPTLQKIIDIGAYFLSRLLPNVKIYKNKEDKDAIDLSEYLKKGQEFEVYLGDQKVPARLVAYKLPEDVINQRLREANKRAKQTGRTLSKNKKICIQFAIFVTNVPREILPTEVVGTIYRLRWEIELVFDRWKNQLKIDYLKGKSKNRIECLIWSRLAMILLIEMISGYIANYVWRLSRLEISEAKIIDYLLSRLLWAVIRNKLEEFIAEMEKDALRRLVKDSRQRRSMREMVSYCESYYEMQYTDNKKVA